MNWDASWKLLDACRLSQITRFTKFPNDRLPPCPIDIPSAIDRLCYRYPSPLVDAITEHEPGRRIKAVKNVTVNEDFFQGHFPGAPVMPGVLMIETLAQVATILLMHGPDGAVDRGAPGCAASTTPSSGCRSCPAIA